MFEAFFTDPNMKYRTEVINGIDFYKMGFKMVRGECVGFGTLRWMQKGETASMLITNTKLPDMSGFELAEQVRKQCPNIRVIFLTDTPSHAEARQAVRLGAYDYLLKSDGVDVLRQSVARLSEDLQAESRKALYIQSQSNWDELIPQMLQLLGALKPGTGEESWKMYSRIKPLLLTDGFCMEKLLVQSLMEELRWEIRRRSEPLFLKLRNEMMQLSPEELTSAQAAAKLLREVHKQLVELGFILPNDALKSDAIGRACVYMHTHMSEKLTAQSMAEYVHISPRHFIRKFQAEMNDTFSNYLAHIRVRAALRMLEDGWDVKSIPEAVGYKDEKSFYYVFRKFAGCSMREYQQKLNLSQREGRL